MSGTKPVDGMARKDYQTNGTQTGRSSSVELVLLSTQYSVDHVQDLSSISRLVRRDNKTVQRQASWLRHFNSTIFLNISAIFIALYDGIKCGEIFAHKYKINMLYSFLVRGAVGRRVAEKAPPQHSTPQNDYCF